MIDGVGGGKGILFLGIFPKRLSIPGLPGGLLRENLDWNFTSTGEHMGGGGGGFEKDAKLDGCGGGIGDWNWGLEILFEGNPNRLLKLGRLDEGLIWGWLQWILEGGIFTFERGGDPKLNDCWYILKGGGGGNKG